MSLVNATNIYHSYGDQPLLDGANLTIEAGERICLVGRNGAGKSTLLKILIREISPDEGDISFARDIRIAELKQEVPEGLQGSVYDCIAAGLGSLSSLITDWHHSLVDASSDPSALVRMQKLQDTIEANDAWNLENRVSTTISRLGLPADTDFSELSGGMKRRVLLGQALVANPDLLLLDEPTNHLDIESIVWLEEFLRAFKGSLLFITHDRSFLQALATRIVDLDRGQLTSWPGDYVNFLRAKQALLDTETTHNALFDKKLAREEVWIIAVEFVAGNDFLGVLEHRRGIQHRLFHIYHDRQPSVPRGGRCLLPILFALTRHSADAICRFKIKGIQRNTEKRRCSGYASILGEET